MQGCFLAIALITFHTSPFYVRKASYREHLDVESKEHYVTLFDDILFTLAAHQSFLFSS